MGKVSNKTLHADAGAASRWEPSQPFSVLRQPKLADGWGGEIGWPLCPNSGGDRGGIEVLGFSRCWLVWNAPSGLARIWNLNC